jgi:hypothetical protein
MKITKTVDLGKAMADCVRLRTSSSDWTFAVTLRYTCQFASRTTRIIHDPQPGGCEIQMSTALLENNE